jgi:hypothetical protein
MKKNKNKEKDDNYIPGKELYIPSKPVNDRNALIIFGVSAIFFCLCIRWDYFMIPAIMLILLGVNNMIHNRLCKGDYVRITKEDIEMHLHQSWLCLIPSIHKTINWKDVKQWTLKEKSNKFSLIIKLNEEEKPHTYKLRSLQVEYKTLSHIKQLARILPRVFAKKEIKATKRNEYFSVIVALGGFILFSANISLFENTMIHPIWGWLISILLIIHTVVCFYKEVFPRYGIGAFCLSVSLLLCYAFFQINYTFADWDSSPNYQEYKIEDKDRSRARHSSKYHVTIKIDKYGKKLTFPDSHWSAVSHSDVIMLDIRKGALGIDVYKDFYFR